MKCFSTDVHIYGTSASCHVSFWHYADSDVCIYSICVFFFWGGGVVDCQVDSDVDNVQRRELVKFYGA